MASPAPPAAPGQEAASASCDQDARTAQVQALLRRLVDSSPIYGFTLSELELERVSRGSVTTRLRLTERHANSKGSLHGAVSAAVVDCVTGLAIASWDGRPTTGASVDMHLSYLATARAGDWLRIEAAAERVGGSLAFVRVSIARVGEAGAAGAADEVVVLAQHTNDARFACLAYPTCPGSSWRRQTPTQTATNSRGSTSQPQARRLIRDVLCGHGVARQHAALVARCLVLADLRGVDTHGINRLPSYCERIRKHALDPTAVPEVKKVTPVVAEVDAKNGFGFVAAHAAMATAIDAARVYGIDLAVVKHSNHFGMSAWLVQQALDAGMMSLVFTNSSPAMPPWGGRNKLLGVSPIACGAPGGGHHRDPDFIVDMAPSVVARGKIYKAQRRGEPIPFGWALDAQGNPTQDASEALAGIMLPVGGPKGSALSIIMDVFSGVLSGSSYAGEVANPYDPSCPADVGHFLVAIKPDLFMSLEDFKARMVYLYQRVTDCEPDIGFDRVYFPGELEHLAKVEREQSGIPLVQAEINALNQEAARVSAAPMETMD